MVCVCVNTCRPLVQVSRVTGNSVTVWWDAVDSDTLGYTVRYKAAGDTHYQVSQHLHCKTLHQLHQFQVYDLTNAMGLLIALI